MKKEAAKAGSFYSVRRFFYVLFVPLTKCVRLGCREAIDHIHGRYSDKIGENQTSENLVLTNIGELGNIKISENLVKEETIMNNDEILKRAQEHPVAEAENEASRKAITMALGVGILILTVMIVAELFIVKRIDFGKPALLLLIAALSNIFEGKNNSRKKELIIGIVESAGALFFLLLYVGGMFR